MDEIAPASSTTNRVVAFHEKSLPGEHTRLACLAVSDSLRHRLLGASMAFVPEETSGTINNQNPRYTAGSANMLERAKAAFQRFWGPSLEAVLEEIEKIDGPEKVFEPKNDHEFIEFYKILRSYIQHEDGLLNYRVTWFLTSQAVIGTAYAVLLHNEVTFSSMFTLAGVVLSSMIVLVLCYVGMKISKWSFDSVHASILAISTVRDYIRSQSFENMGFPELTSGGNRMSLDNGSRLALGLPILMKRLWPGLFVLFAAIAVLKIWWSVFG